MSHQEMYVGGVAPDFVKKKKVDQGDSPEFVKCQTGFQANLYEAIADEKLREQGRTDEEIEQIDPEEKAMMYMQDIMDFNNNHAAAYKVIIRENKSFFDEILKLEKDNPGPRVKKGATDEERDLFVQQKEKYESTKPQRQELAQAILKELRSDRMITLNTVMEALKVGKAVDRGGMSLNEFMNYIKKRFEELYAQDKNQLIEAVSNEEELNILFREALTAMWKAREEEESKPEPQKPN